MLSVRQPEENENISQAPTLGGFGGVVTGQTGGQRGRGTVSGRGSGFTNLQSYIRANESNPNAQLIQQRAGQATQAQRQAQTGFETQAGQARGQLEGIQSQAGLVSSALQDPTKFVSIPENVQRITALRTGQEAIANPTAIQQNVLQGAEGLQSQRGMIGQALQRDVTGTGLQEYLRSQRVNPALATAGENRLDRFLAEQTTSGQQAIGGAMTEAERIAALSQPEQVGQIGELVSQIQANPLSTQAGIQNALIGASRPEQEFIQGLNRDYIANQMGIDVDEVLRIANDYKEVNRQINELNAEKQNHENEIANLEAEIARNRRDQNRDDLTEPQRQNARNLIRQNEALLRQRQEALNRTNVTLSGRISSREGSLQYYQDATNKYNDYLNQVQQNRENILSRFDPNRLARVRALSQISGFDFSPYLTRGV